MADIRKVVDIKYEKNGFSSGEETKFTGLREGGTFSFGNQGKM